jgi:hypothetical protein
MLRKNIKQKVGKVTELNRLFERIRNSVAIEALLKLSMTVEVLFKVVTVPSVLLYLEHITHLVI